MTPEEARKAFKEKQKQTKKQHGIAPYPTMIYRQTMSGKPLSETQKNYIRAIEQKKEITTQTKYAKANQINLAIKYPWRYFWDDDKWHERKSGGGGSSGGGGAIQT